MGNGYTSIDGKILIQKNLSQIGCVKPQMLLSSSEEG
jgi:hypothetical protein